MNPTLILGQVLLWSGFLSGSLATVFQLENKEDVWSTINWPWYIASVVVCIFGIAAIRVSKRAKQLDSDVHEASYAILPKSTERIQASIAQLRKNQNAMKPSEIIAFIDDNIVDDLRDFVDSREAIIAQRNLQDYADVMTQFAAGERAINRCWSAAADSYVDEVELCLERADAFFEKTQQLLKD